MKKFKKYKGLNLSDLNKEMLELWNADNLFEQSVALREGAPSYVFYEGPPSANGMPGIHHVMARTIKDLFCRYKTMKGFHVKRKAGWDTHGLPVELGVERSLGITKEDIGKKISVDEYNAACRREVMKYTREWETLTNKMGYWVDTTDPYITYDNRYIESVWWLLAQLYGKNLLYKGYTIQPYSPAAGTGLSSHELNQPGCYRDVKDTTCVAQFKVTDPIEKMKGWGTPCMLAWTTTPWTLPSNTALAVGPSIRYCIVRTYNPYSGDPVTVVVAEALLGTLFNAKAKEISLEDYNRGDKLVPYEVVDTVSGSDLVGMHYEQLLPWVNPGEGAFRVIPGDYVTTDDGTGVVHIAGTFGADDLRVSRAAGVPPLHLIDRDGNLRPMVDLTGRFYRIEDLDPDFVKNMVDTEQYSQWAGRYVKNAYDPEAADDTETLDVAICMDLKASGKVFKIEKHVHNYPHCWRTDKPVLYYPLDSWFIRSTAMRERLMELNETIKWKPASTGTGRFGKWLENLQDWNLSRSRYWGTPLPIWRTESGDEEICIDSVATLYNEIDKAVAAGVMSSNPLRDKGFVPGDYSKDNYEKIDLHRPYVDDIVLVSASGKPMKRETDLIDVWFDSGSMPYAQIHYPFENKEAFDRGDLFPADFIAEGVDQTRGWFFTLHAIGTMVFDSCAFKAVISNGLVLDKKGEKMSKRKGNAVDPFETIEKYGSDPLRWYMISCSSPWDNLKYDSEGVAEVSRKFFSTLSNTYDFFAMYANVDGYTGDEAEVPVAERPELDRWILSLLNSLVASVEESLEDYEPTRAVRAISEFVLDKLSNWYVRLNRKRFWERGLDTDKLAAYQTLRTCLLTIARLMAPVAPFFSDRLYRDLTEGTDAAKSVHLADFPAVDSAVIDRDLEERMDVAQRLTSLVLSLRKKANLKVRQPLAR
ncbi:MAG: isoleucine--tRNA ligase, partial [Muribaculaceae bacterium]|nr:isoleucine--tRNA ligase [Muribaculaceae bacterium]